ncbi:MAG: hypothetical protein AAF211_25600, partial [Myxococcota bacterium]
RQRHVEALPEEVDGDWLPNARRATVALSERTLEGLRRRDPEGVDGCDAFVVVSTSHVGFPSLSRILVAEAGLPPEATCWDLSGLGCAGPSQGLYHAWSLLQAGAETVCILFVDTMATWAEARRWTSPPTMSEIVAHCLASDGAAGVVLGRRPGPAPQFSFEGCALATRQWPDSLDQNDFAIRDGQPFLSVGKDIRTRLLDEAGRVFTPEFVEHPTFLHPGGPDLMKRLAAAHPALAETIDVSMSVLLDHGNLGSASVLFVLEEARRRGLPIDPRFHLFALGPGIVTTTLRVDGVEA